MLKGPNQNLLINRICPNPLMFLQGGKPCLPNRSQENPVFQASHQCMRTTEPSQSGKIKKRVGWVGLKSTQIMTVGMLRHDMTQFTLHVPITVVTLFRVKPSLFKKLVLSDNFCLGKEALNDTLLLTRNFMLMIGRTFV